jgi:SAM-dependent methyltransferase
MFENDVDLLRSPKSGRPLRLVDVRQTTSDGDILDAHLLDEEDSTRYPITNGIPRFVGPGIYNKSWDFKWRVLDGGRGLNYRIIDKGDPAYQVHDLFDRNAYGGEVYARATGRLALDVGCGVGQYSVRLLQEFSPAKLVALDLTGGVDIFRTIVAERYPEFRKALLIVQANIFEPPFAKEQFDFIMSLGVLMHTGDTRRALGQVFDLLKPEGTVNFWIYASEPVAYDVAEAGRGHAHDMKNFRLLQAKYRRVLFWLRLFRRMSNDQVLRILQFMSSERVYKLLQTPRFRFVQNWFPTVEHPDYAYRLINNYDGYVNSWSDSWNESEIFPLMKQHGIVIRDLAGWRLGVWGLKRPAFYQDKQARSAQPDETQAARDSASQTSSTIKNRDVVHIQSYPKTGNTWARFLLGNYFQIIANLPDTVLLEGDEQENSLLREFGLPAFFATHAPLLWETQTARDLSYENVVLPYCDDTVILMIRYPLDAVLSHYMQHHFGRGHQSRRKFFSLFEFAADPVFGLEKAIRYYNIWAEALGRERIFPLKYEQLRTATQETARSLLSFLGLSCDESALTQAIAHSSFHAMRKMETSGNVPRYRSSGLMIFATGDLNEQNSYFVRQGRFREYREHLDAREIRLFETMIHDELSPVYGYRKEDVESLQDVTS